MTLKGLQVIRFWWLQVILLPPPSIFGRKFGSLHLSPGSRCFDNRFSSTYHVSYTWRILWFFDWRILKGWGWSKFFFGRLCGCFAKKLQGSSVTSSTFHSTLEIPVNWPKNSWPLSSWRGMRQWTFILICYICTYTSLGFIASFPTL